MPTPKLPLPESPRTTLFRAIIKKIQSNPDLKRVVKTWQVWDGSPDDLAAITSTQCPAVILTPVSYQAQPETVGQHDSPFIIRLTTWINGTNADDVMNFWGVLERAIYPRDGTMQTILNQCQANSLNLLEPGFKLEGDENKMMVSEGSIMAKMFANTRT